MIVLLHFALNLKSNPLTIRILSNDLKHTVFNKIDPKCIFMKQPREKAILGFFYSKQ